MPKNIKAKPVATLFFTEQIETTIKIVKHFANSKEFSPAMLFNSLLSLVILPFESAKTRDGEKIFPGSFADIQKKLKFAPIIFQPINKCEDGTVKYYNKTTYAFVKKFRHAIAHQNIEIPESENTTVHIRLFNKFQCRYCKKCKQKECVKKGLKYTTSAIKDFEIDVSIEQLQSIALYIANCYLKAIKGK
ncbi:MAG: hypothetical protein LBT12_03790 [Oscillospiraceae bacterium]|nr:hypothetical protein [Oscillospiraceae bacterium]